MNERKLRPAAVFSNNMVLQQGKAVAVFGTAPTGETVTAEINGAAARTVCEDGRWELSLPAQKAGGPYTLTLCGAGETIAFENVLVGEVWLAAGQSNMELELQNCADGKAALAASADPLLRFYNTPKQPCLNEAHAKAEAESSWQVCGPDTAATMSAAAYFYAKKMRQLLGVPIGILDCYWGGTSVTSWQSREQLQKTLAGHTCLSEYEARTAGQTEAEYDAKEAKFNREMDVWNGAVAALRKNEPKADAARVAEVCGPCPWFPPEGAKSPFRPAGLYYTMVQRVCPYTVKGVLWYQGEEDAANRPRAYAALLLSLISLWRTDWHDSNLPFLVVQLPMYIAKTDADAGKDDLSFPLVREQQEKAVDLARDTYLTVLTDCGEFDNIHPLDKQTVGLRLALTAAKHIYGLGLTADGPRAVGVTFENGAAMVHFASAEPLCVKGERLAGFTLAGADGHFVPAKAELCGMDVRVLSEAVPAPRAVRYAFTNYGPATLYNAAGLPARTWRSDAAAPLDEKRG